MRCRIVMELVRNSHRYINGEGIGGLDVSCKIAYLSDEAALQSPADSHDQNVTIYEKETMSVRNIGCHMGLRQLAAAASIIGVDIESVYPTNMQMRLALQNQKAAEKFKQQVDVLKEKLGNEERCRKQLQKKVQRLRKINKVSRREKEKYKKTSKYYKERYQKKLAGETELENEQENIYLNTKKDGEYIDSVRFCVMELTGLEVATAKVGPVMEAVGELCGITFSDLPSRVACQNIVDKGHYIAKKFIRSRLKRCKSFGVHKDGTTRKKVKILDSSVHTDDGESYCLGWSSVAAETGEAILKDVTDKLEEVAGTEDNMKEVLTKLVYVMNDRAANEKKSNRLLEEWREECLKECKDVKKIHSLYCAAHVMLAFHSYVLASIKKMRDFECSDLKHPLTVLLKDANDLFEPVGDFRGVRNQWLGYCQENNIKSAIKSYKDNRSNRLFEVSAQVFHHHKDFIYILDSLKSKNFKLTRLSNSLKNPKLILLIECLALFFHNITGPFWTMVISRKGTYAEFSFKVKHLQESLKKCTVDPNFFFEKGTFEFFNFPSGSPETRSSLTDRMKKGMKKVLTAISEGMLTTVEVQLKDFLEGGTYGSEEEVIKIPEKAPLTNSVCERNFGHLDSSQRRRPRSSLHHHTSVFLLKQTRKQLREWFNNTPTESRKLLLKGARQEGRMMRQKHVKMDREANNGNLP